MWKQANIRSARETIRNPSGLLQLQFLRVTERSLRRQYQAMQEDIRSKRIELAVLEDARLHIRNQGEYKNFRCSYSGGTKQMGITGDDKRIHELARRAFLEDQINATEKELRRLIKLIDSVAAGQDEQRILARLKRFDDAGLDLCRIIFSKEQNEWIDEPYTPNPYNPERLTNPTRGEILMRSKSEANIGNMFEDLGIPYRYDDIVRIKPDGPRRPHRDTYFADLKCPNFCNGITVHEHLGAFHLEHYADGSLQRLNDYHDFTVYELSEQPVRYNEFTVSYESDLKSPNLRKELIRRILLPYPA